MGRGERLVRFAELLEQASIPTPHNYAWASLLMERLHRWCWAHETDILGSDENVERVLSPHPAVTGGQMARMLSASGIVGVVEGQYYLPTVMADDVTRALKRWYRDNNTTYTAASKRSLNKPRVNRKYRLPNVVQEAPVKAPSFGGGLFGDLDSEAAMKRERLKHGHTQLTKYWFDQWSERYDGRDYPFTGKDGRAIKAIVSAAGTYEAAKTAIDNYLRTNTAFTKGHPLAKLQADLPRYITTGPAACKYESGGELRVF